MGHPVRSSRVLLINSENYQFSCILISNNRFYDVTITKQIKAEISPFKWEFSVNYTYKNLFFEQFWMKYPKVSTIVSDQYFIVVLTSTEHSGIALYERYASPYVKDFQSLLPEDPTVTLRSVFGAFLSENKKTLHLVGMDKEVSNQLSLANYTFEEQKIIIKDPANFIKEKLQFKLDFFNKKSIKFVFNIRGSKKTDPKNKEKRSGLIVFLLSLMILLILLILGNLLILVLMLKNQKEEELESVLMSESSQMEESFRATNMRSTDF